MTTRTIEIDELKTLIAGKLDIHELLDIIGFDMWELVDALEEPILEHYEELLDACK